MADFITAFFSHLYTKGGIYGIFAVVCFVLGLFVFIYNKFHFQIDLWLRKKKFDRIVSQFYSNSKDILPEADYTYYKGATNGLTTNKILDKIDSSICIGVLVHSQFVIENNINLLLEFRYEDFDLTPSGKIGQVKKRNLMYLKINCNLRENNLTVKGEVFDDRFEKKRIMNYLSKLDF